MALRLSANVAQLEIARALLSQLHPVEYTSTDRLPPTLNSKDPNADGAQPHSARPNLAKLTSEQIINSAHQDSFEFGLT